MTTSTVDHSEHEAAGHTDAHHPSDGMYWRVFAILVVITGAEVALSYMESDLGAAFLPLLFLLMAVKFVMVVSVFMHLRFDNKLFTWIFYSGLALAVAVYVAFLTTADFWGT
ncbi:MAG: cytochrome C oxidase subunit IV family protein [Acidimicrobiia bacterium]